MGDAVKWDTSHLFEYEALLEAAARRKKYKRNVSVSRTSLQIKLDITLKIGDGALGDRTTIQLIWMGKPDGIGLELRDDLERLLKRPLTRSSVARQPVSRKGSLQSVSLSDVATLQPAYRQDSGSLVPKSDPAYDVGQQFSKALKAAANGRLSGESAAAVGAAWGEFRLSIRGRNRRLASKRPGRSSAFGSSRTLWGAPEDAWSACARRSQSTGTLGAGSVVAMRRRNGRRSFRDHRSLAPVTVGGEYGEGA